MLNVEMLPAQQGDALWIEWGDAKRPHRMLLDGGTGPTSDVLRERIAALPEGERRFELLVVSHIDNDHIAGVLPLLADEQLGATFADVWFNGFRHLPETPVQSLGPVEGEKLTMLLAGRDWNAAFDGGAIVVPDEGALPSCTLEGGLTLTLLSPGLPQLAALRPEWAETVRAHGLDPADPEPEPLPELPAGIQALGAEVPDVTALAAKPFGADGAKPNGTSIALLAEHEGSSVLLAADAFPAVVLAQVERLLAERNGADRLALDAFKLPHHGSKANIHLPLLQRVACDRFLFSSNGSKTRHPNEEAVARVLATHDKPELLFNYRTRFNEAWGRADVVERYGHTAVFPSDGQTGLLVEL